MGGRAHARAEAIMPGGGPIMVERIAIGACRGHGVIGVDHCENLACRILYLGRLIDEAGATIARRW